MNNQYKTLMDCLNDGSFYNTEKLPKTCCDKPDIKYDSVYSFSVCVSCGIVKDNNIELEEESKAQVLNPLYEVSTKLGNATGSKYRGLNRLHNWKGKEELKEINANDRYEEIKGICETFFKSKVNEIYKKASYYYMEVYMNQNICSRGKIRFCNYIYCIYQATLQMGLDIDIIDLINSVYIPSNKKEPTEKDTSLTIKNFNDSLANIKRLLLERKDYNKEFLNETQQLYLHKDLNKYRELLNENYALSYTQYEFIQTYNIILKNARSQYKKINYPNIIAGTIISLCDNKDIVKFCIIFETTEKIYNYGDKLI